MQERKERKDREKRETTKVKREDKKKKGNTKQKRIPYIHSKEEGPAHPLHWSLSQFHFLHHPLPVGK